MQKTARLPAEDRLTAGPSCIVRVAASLCLLATVACDAAPSTVELWIEPPDIYRFGTAEAAPLDLPADRNQKVQVLASALREAVAESDTPEKIAVFAPYTGTGLNDPEYTLLQQAACEAGVREFDLALVDPYDPDAPERIYDPAAAAPYPPPECGMILSVKPDSETPKREFLPDPPY